MPSPSQAKAIPLSNSDSDFLSPSSQSKARIISSNRSTSTSSRSNKSVYWLAWSNVNKLGTFIHLGRRSIDSSSRHSDLTEESLEAHNRRQEAIILSTVDDKNAKCSPYYKGLTDYSLIINREKHHFPPPCTSPERESHATTVATSSSISSFVFVKMQEWSSCFSSVSLKPAKDKQINNDLPPPPATQPPVPAPCFAPPHPPPALPSEPSVEKKGPDKNSLLVVNEKPLRERVSSPECHSALLPTATNADEKSEIITNMFDGREKFTWAGKYRPRALKDFICNRSTAIKVQGLIRGIDCNHFIFEGPPGVGKRTMIWAMIGEAFGPDGLQTTREESKAFNLMGESIGSIEVRIKVSSQHIEVNLSDLKGYEKHVIVELIKESNHGKSTNSSHSKFNPCRAILLYNSDKLSADAVLYIKWLLERYKGSSKFFFCCSDVSKLQPIKELCTFVQLFLPSNKEIVEVLEFIAKQEGIQLPGQFAERIAEKSKNNLRQAIRSLEASWQRSYPFTEDQEILTGWEDDIRNIAKDIVEEQSPKQLYVIRGKLQNLIEHDVSPDFIFSTLREELKRFLPESCQVLLENLYKDYNRKDGNTIEGENQLLFSNNRHEEMGKRLHDHPARTKFQQFMNIEEFIAKFMSCYKSQASSKYTYIHSKS